MSVSEDWKCSFSVDWRSSNSVFYSALRPRCSSRQQRSRESRTNPLVPFVLDRRRLENSFRIFNCVGLWQRECWTRSFDVRRGQVKRTSDDRVGLGRRTLTRLRKPRRRSSRYFSESRRLTIERTKEGELLVCSCRSISVFLSN